MPPASPSKAQARPKEGLDSCLSVPYFGMGSGTEGGTLEFHESQVGLCCPDPWVDPESRSTSGFYNIHLRLLLFEADYSRSQKFEYNHPPTPKPREEGKPATTVLAPYSNFLESTVPSFLAQGAGAHRPCRLLAYCELPPVHAAAGRSTQARRVHRRSFN